MDWLLMDVNFNTSIVKTLKTLKFKSPTPVQAKCIPLFMNYKDVVVEAVTGSGKTLAFVIPILEMLLKRTDPWRPNEIGAIVISPTRELATQISEVISHFLRHLNQFSQILLVGGSNPIKDVKQFIEKGGNIIVATPGRLLDMFERKSDDMNFASSVKSLEVLILDEADRLLDMGFETSINTILRFLPKLRRTGLFSATQTDAVGELIRVGLRNPVTVSIKSSDEKSHTDSNQRIPSTLNIYYAICEADQKFNNLVNFLVSKSGQKCMVFFSTCASVDYFSFLLQRLLKGTKVLCIHGKMRERRYKIFDEFKNLSSGVLACTDVMARGVDIPDVHWVIQFDPPKSCSTLVHRCGRTARSGNTGNAVLMLMPTEDTFVYLVAVNQQVEMQDMTEMMAGISVEDFLPRVREIAICDRSCFDKGNRAFVSYIQSYSKNECNIILRLKDLDIGKVAEGFGLIRLPRMPELKNKQFPNFQPTEIDANLIPYLDKAREKLRQEKLKIYKESGKWPGMKSIPSKKAAWSQIKQIDKQKKERREKRRNSKLNRKRKRNEPHTFDDDDLEDLAKDTKLIKKLKKGKISREKFDEEFIGDEDQDFGDLSNS